MNSTQLTMLRYHQHVIPTTHHVCIECIFLFCMKGAPHLFHFAAKSQQAREHGRRMRRWDNDGRSVLFLDGNTTQLSLSDVKM
jgi:hypothetical protein